MARLKLSPSGLRGPLDLVPPTPAEEPTAERPSAPRIAALPRPTLATPAADAAPGSAAPAEEPAAPEPAVLDAPAPATAAPAVDERVAVDAPPAVPADADAPSVHGAAPRIAAAPGVPAADDELPAWARELPAEALQPERLLGRPKQTALILDRELSARADALVAATGPRVTFAALVTAVLHFHLPTDGGSAARTIGAYRRRRLESLEQPWEERNARVPEPLRDALDDVVAGATGKVAAVRRSTLVNALLDAHLPAEADGAARLVTRMEMVRGGAFLAL